MTVKELKEKLNEFPEDVNVRALIFSNGIIYKVDVDSIDFSKIVNAVSINLYTDPVKQENGTYRTHICGLYD